MNISGKSLSEEAERDDSSAFADSGGRLWRPFPRQWYWAALHSSLGLHGSLESMEFDDEPVRFCMGENPPIQQNRENLLVCRFEILFIGLTQLQGHEKGSSEDLGGLVTLQLYQTWPQTGGNHWRTRWSDAGIWERSKSLRRFRGGIRWHSQLREAEDLWWGPAGIHRFSGVYSLSSKPFRADPTVAHVHWKEVDGAGYDSGHDRRTWPKSSWGDLLSENAERET